ncbi:MAG: DUF2332 domain-containing protein [Ferruginibacter sp.]
MNVEKTKERFINFADSECKGNSQLYYQLSNHIANDDDLLEIASTTRPGQPIPNIFLAAVHYLLLKNPENNLAKYYPSIEKKDSTEIPFNLFKTFCIENKNEIINLISNKIVQTNVINRCAYLMPIFSNILSEENKPTTIIDIGTSAGLTLNFDQYEYWYNDQKVFGNSKVKVKSDILESSNPKIFPINQHLSKIGIDQNIIDPTDEDEILWLKALIWPDQQERFNAMDEALKLEELKNIQFVKAQSILDFEKEILKINKDENLIIYSTHVLYQFTGEQKDVFYSMLDKIGSQRDFYFLSVEGIEILQKRHKSEEIVIELTNYKGNKKKRTFIAETNGHGNWIKWKK